MNEILKGIQLAITYLFMNADGVCRGEELKHYKELCDGLKASDRMKKGIEDYAKTIPISDGDNSEVIISAIDNILGFSEYNNERPHTCDMNVNAAVSGDFSHYLNYDKVCQARLIWTLINMGYADREYSLPEQKVVEHIVKLWNFDITLFDEMIDTADTALAIVGRKQWQMKNACLSKKCTDGDDEYANDIEKLYQNINISIENANL